MVKRSFASQDTRKVSPVGFLYVLPALLVYAIFFLWPLLNLVQLSAVRWTGLQPRIFVGMANYAAMFEDSRAIAAVVNNVKWTLAALIVPISVGMTLALLLGRSKLYGRTFFRTVFFLPQVLSSVIVGVIFGAIYNPSYGIINTVLRRMDLASLARPWLGTQTFAFPAIFIAWSWVQYGFCMMIFLAALQSIDEEYFDAAKVDGANSRQQIWHIALPAMRGPLSTVILLTAIAAFQVFDLIYVTTGGGPVTATLVLAVHMFDTAFFFDNPGYGAALAVALGVLIMLMTWLFQRIGRRFSEAD